MGGWWCQFLFFKRRCNHIFMEISTVIYWQLIKNFICTYIYTHTYTHTLLSKIYNHMERHHCTMIILWGRIHFEEKYINTWYFGYKWWDLKAMVCEKRQIYHSTLGKRNLRWRIGENGSKKMQQCYNLSKSYKEIQPVVMGWDQKIFKIIYFNFLYFVRLSLHLLHKPLKKIPP